MFDREDEAAVVVRPGAGKYLAYAVAARTGNIVFVTILFSRLHWNGRQIACLPLPAHGIYRPTFACRQSGEHEWGDMRRGILALAMLATSANAAESKFNLECIGRSAHLEVGGQRHPGDTPGQIRLSVDLDAKLWCQGECTYSRPLTFDAEKITLTPGRSSPDGKWTDGAVIQRTGGEMAVTAAPTPKPGEIPKLLMVMTYRCNLTPFSGIPQPKL